MLSPLDWQCVHGKCIPCRQQQNEEHFARNTTQVAINLHVKFSCFFLLNDAPLAEDKVPEVFFDLCPSIDLLYSISILTFVVRTRV